MQDSAITTNLSWMHQALIQKFIKMSFQIVPLHQQNLKWVEDDKMSACCAKQIQHATTWVPGECQREKFDNLCSYIVRLNIWLKILKL